LDIEPHVGDTFASHVDRRSAAHIESLRPSKLQMYLSFIRRPNLATRIPFLRSLARKA